MPGLSVRWYSRQARTRPVASLLLRSFTDTALVDDRLLTGIRKPRDRSYGRTHSRSRLRTSASRRYPLESGVSGSGQTRARRLRAH